MPSRGAPGAASRIQIREVSSYALGTITEVVNRQQEIQGKILAVITPKIANDWTLDITVGGDVNERNGRSQQVYGVDFVIPGLFNLTNTRGLSGQIQSSLVFYQRNTAGQGGYCSEEKWARVIAPV